MTTAQKNKIDSMSYEALLRLWRNAPLGSSHPLLIGETGLYFKKVMLEKKEKIGHDAAVATSKNIDWGRG